MSKNIEEVGAITEASSEGHPIPARAAGARRIQGAVLYGPGDSRFEDRETPRIIESITGPTPMGHEYCGVVAPMRRFPTRILTMSLAGAISLAGADARDAVAQQSAPVASSQQVRNMKIRMDVEGTVITATLDDNATSRDFVSLLPLTLTLQDYAATEKISNPPRKLSTAGAPPGYDPSIGDISYYAPWGNLALFYRDFGYSSGLIKLGTIDSGVERLRQPAPLKVTIERVEEQP